MISKMRNIHKSTLPSFRRRENAAAIVKAPPPPGALTKGPNRKYPGLHPPPGGTTSSSLSINGRFGFPILVLLAVLALGLLFLLPAGPLQAQGDGIIEYAENSRDPVATFSSEDPDGDTITWSVDGTDGELFEFSDDNPGELNFVTSPNYEMPRGLAASETNTNTYEITVTATDDGTLTATKDVMVKVTDVEERATIELSTRQPVVGRPVMATLGNDDEVVGGVRWAWEKKDGTSWVDVTGTPMSTDAMETEPHTGTYAPVQNEIDAELRVGVQYIDTDDDNQTVAAVAFEQAVAATVGGTNALSDLCRGRYDH